MPIEAAEGNDAERVLSCLADGTIQGVEAFFRGLSFRTDVVPRPVEFEGLPDSARAAITGEPALVAEVPDPAVPFRVFAIPVSAQRVRTSVRSLLTAFYRKVPQGNNLFVFSRRAWAEMRMMGRSASMRRLGWVMPAMFGKPRAVHLSVCATRHLPLQHD